MQIFVLNVPVAPTECAGGAELNGLLYGAETLGPFTFSLLLFGIYRLLGRCTFLCCSGGSVLFWKKVKVGFLALLWSLQTYMLTRALDPFMPTKEASGIELGFGVITIVLHVAVVTTYTRHLYTADKGRRGSYLGSMVLAYKDERWWWYLAVTLQLDLAIVAQAWNALAVLVD